MPGGRRDENSAAVQAVSEQDSPGEGEGRAFIDKSRVHQIIVIRERTVCNS